MSTKELVPATAGKDLITFDQSKLDLIKKTIAKDLTDPEFNLFIGVAKARGLDPVLHQIHAVKRNDNEAGGKRLVLQVAIDGFRLIAARTGEYAGRDETVFTYNDKDELIRATVTVYRFVNGHKCSWTASARWDEYYPGEKMGFMWRKFPETMLEKCAEAKVLRMAFPNDLSGLYVQEEVAEKDITPLAVDDANKPKQFEDDSRVKAINSLLGNYKKLGVSEYMIRNKFNKSEGFDLMGLSDVELDSLRSIGKTIVSEKRNINEFFSVKNHAENIGANNAK